MALIVTGAKELEWMFGPRRAAVGDRVTILHREHRRGRITPRRGQIIGESRDRISWNVRRDDLKYPVGYHKTFVVAETIEAFRNRNQPPG